MHLAPPSYETGAPRATVAGTASNPNPSLWVHFANGGLLCLDDPTEARDLAALLLLGADALEQGRTGDIHARPEAVPA